MCISALRPAPDTPDLASAIRCWRSTSPGFDAAAGNPSCTAVGITAGIGNEPCLFDLPHGSLPAGRTPPRPPAPGRRAPCRTTSPTPPMSLMRKSAARSITFTPASSSARACFMATPLGVAKNTTSQAVPAPASSGAENASSTRPRRLGNMSATGMPASLREVIDLQLHLRVLRQQTQQFDAGVPGTADNADFDHAVIPMQIMSVIVRHAR